MFSFKHKVHNWLKEEEKEHKRDHSLRNSTRSNFSKSQSSIWQKVVEEKLRVVELNAEASFMKKKRCWVSSWSTTDEGRICKSKSKSRGILWHGRDWPWLGIDKDTEVFPPETLKYWFGVQWGQSYLIGRRCLFSLGWPPSSDGITIKMPYGVDVLHWPALHPIFSYSVG